MYCKRAQSLLELVKNLKGYLKVPSNETGRLELVLAVVESINRLLFTFRIDSDINEKIQKELNEPLYQIQTPQDVEKVVTKATRVLVLMEEALAEWVRFHCDGEEKG